MYVDTLTFKQSSVHLILLVEGGHELVKHEGADVDHAHDPRQGHKLVHQRVQFALAHLQI